MTRLKSSRPRLVTSSVSPKFTGILLKNVISTAELYACLIARNFYTCFGNPFPADSTKVNILNSTQALPSHVVGAKVSRPWLPTMGLNTSSLVQRPKQSTTHQLTSQINERFPEQIELRATTSLVWLMSGAKQPRNKVMGRSLHRKTGNALPQTLATLQVDKKIIRYIEQDNLTQTLVQRSTKVPLFQHSRSTSQFAHMFMEAIHESLLLPMAQRQQPAE